MPSVLLRKPDSVCFRYRQVSCLFSFEPSQRDTEHLAIVSWWLIGPIVWRKIWALASHWIWLADDFILPGRVQDLFYRCSASLPVWAPKWDSAAAEQTPGTLISFCQNSLWNWAWEMGQSSLFWNRTQGCLTMLHMTGLGTYPKRGLWQQASPIPYRLPRTSSECMNLSARTCLWYYMCLSSLSFPPPLILKPICPRNLGNPWENSNTHTKTLVDRDRQNISNPARLCHKHRMKLHTPAL